jgi:uncharacterized damage-inducible protein DinB
MTIKEHIIDQLNYNHWANQKIYTPIDSITAELAITSSFNSLKATIYHTWDAETIWIERLMGNPEAEFFASNKHQGSFEEAVQAMLKQEQALIVYITEKDEAFMIQKTAYKNMAGSEFNQSNMYILQHIINHSTFHRGQAITMLRHAGKTEIPATDLIAWYRINNK